MEQHYHLPILEDSTQYQDVLPVPDNCPDSDIIKPSIDTSNTSNVFLPRYTPHQVPDLYHDMTIGHSNQSPLQQMDNDHLQTLSDASSQDASQGNQQFLSFLEVYQSLGDIQTLPLHLSQPLHQQPPQGTTLGGTHSPTDVSVLAQPRPSPGGSLATMQEGSLFAQSTPSPGGSHATMQVSLLAQSSPSPGGSHATMQEVSLLAQSSPSPGGSHATMEEVSLAQSTPLPGGSHATMQEVPTSFASPSSHSSPLKLKGGRRGRRSTQPKPKLYEMEQFADPIREKKRQDAINSRQNRVRRKTYVEGLQRELEEFTAKRNKLQEEIQALKQREMELRRQITTLMAVRNIP